MSGSATTGGLDEALAPMREQLGADGYGLQASLTDEHVLEVEVVALDDACEECLVPRDLLATMLADQLTTAGHPVDDIRVRYPTDA